MNAYVTTTGPVIAQGPDVRALDGAHDATVVRATHDFPTFPLIRSAFAQRNPRMARQAVHGIGQRRTAHHHYGVAGAGLLHLALVDHATRTHQQSDGS